ncbi:tripartite tricarboxylate transporter substrate-binding protein [Roseomonas gilardii]|uniref:tripartite tricarboxylate transporter substrate-binding protein n=1 Tax=Roseomonas gilardii TaxID=257708 RepID=UPI0021B61C62|nr:tripartite tricarboxylate transporter substrate-binding protein [Roseomonas gilardii]
MIGEVGAEGIDARACWGALATSQTPGAILDRFHAALSRTLVKPQVDARMSASLGIESAASTSAEFGQFLTDQIETWTRVVRQHDIRPD